MEFGMRGIQIQVHSMIAVLHRVETWQKKSRQPYLRRKEFDGGVLPVLDSLDNYKMLSERIERALAIYLPCRKFRLLLTSAQPESAVMHIISII